MTISWGDAMDLSPDGTQKRSCLAVSLVLGQRQAVASFLVPTLNLLRSYQMRLLLVKRGSGLPLYLRLVTDHLRLFTLYEQVGCSLVS